jgi:hypothetical protein
MTRTKLFAISAITAVMILASTLVFAAAPGSDATDTSASQVGASVVVAPDLSAADPRPAPRGGGGGGRILKK